MWMSEKYHNTTHKTNAHQIIVHCSNPQIANELIIDETWANKLCMIPNVLPAMTGYLLARWYEFDIVSMGIWYDRTVID